MNRHRCHLLPLTIGQRFVLRPRWGHNKPQRLRDSSVEVKPDWTLLEEIPFPTLQKLSAEYDEPTDVRNCGTRSACAPPMLHTHVCTHTNHPASAAHYAALCCWGIAGVLDFYDESYNRITAKTDKKLEPFPDRAFHNHVTTSEDPVIQQLAKEGAAQVNVTTTPPTEAMSQPGRPTLPTPDPRRLCVAHTVLCCAVRRMREGTGRARTLPCASTGVRWRAAHWKALLH